MKKITSADNERYKSLIKLGKKKHRDREGLYIIEGINLIEEAVKNGAVLKSIFIREDFSDQAVLSIIDTYDADKYLLTNRLFDSFADTETPQGIAAIAVKPSWTEEEFFDGTDNIIVLDRLQDPGNIGTILRTADACGFSGAVIMKGTADLFSPKTVRATAGSLYRVKMLYVDTPLEALEILSKRGKKTVCTSPHVDTLYFDADIASDTALIIGNEAGGACDEFMSEADISVTLPMEGTIESLNAAVAASVLMYDSVRQRHMSRRG